MFRERRVGSRRVTLVAGAVLVLTGATSAFFAVPALAITPAQQAADSSPKVAGTPCTSAAAACVDVRKKQAWLVKDGKVFRGPVAIATGGKGEDTPTGDVFRVYRKDKTHTSSEFPLANGKPAPMPDSVFFEDGGIAFHAGSPSRASAGCVHLSPADALAFFNFLQIGDHVQVKDGPVAAPDPTATPSTNGDNNNGSDDNGSHDNGSDSGHDHGDSNDD